MDTSTSSTVLLDHAAGVLARRWAITPATATEALRGAADELGLDPGDLAALVAAAEVQRFVRPPVRRLPAPTGWSVRGGRAV